MNQCFFTLHVYYYDDTIEIFINFQSFYCETEDEWGCMCNILEYNNY